MKRITIILLISLFFLGGLPFNTVSDSPTLINSIDDLYNIRNNPTHSYLLTKDLDFDNLSHYDAPNQSTKLSENTTGEGWLPIPSFSGTLSGGNYTISNLFINRPYSGLFEESNGTIKDLGLSSVSINSPHFAGPFAIESSGLIENCYATGNISSEGAGGIVYSNSGIIEKSYSSIVLNITNILFQQRNHRKLLLSLRRNLWSKNRWFGRLQRRTRWKLLCSW